MMYAVIYLSTVLQEDPFKDMATFISYVFGLLQMLGILDYLKLAFYLTLAVGGVYALYSVLSGRRS